jgi:formylglycine-generating enzyme required for sulfatase activity
MNGIYNVMKLNLLLAIIFSFSTTHCIAVDLALLSMPIIEVTEFTGGLPGQKSIRISGNGVELRFLSIPPIGLFLGNDARSEKHPEEAKVFFTPDKEYWMQVVELDIDSWNVFSGQKKSESRKKPVKSDGRRRPVSDISKKDADEWVINFNAWMAKFNIQYIVEIPTENEWEHAFMISMTSADRNVNYDEPIGEIACRKYFSDVSKFAVIREKKDDEVNISFDSGEIALSGTKEPIGFLNDMIGNLEEITVFEPRGDERWNILELSNGKRLICDIVLKGGNLRSTESTLFPSSRYFRQGSLICPETGIRLVLKSTDQK